jgi:hypothetical protein
MERSGKPREIPRRQADEDPAVRTNRAPMTSRPSTNPPLVVPRSRTKHEPDTSARIAACCRETPTTSTTTSLCGSRPIRNHARRERHLRGGSGGRLVAEPLSARAGGCDR